MIKKATMHLRINIKKTQLTTINALARLARYSYDITSDLWLTRGKKRKKEKLTVMSASSSSSFSPGDDSPLLSSAALGQCCDPSSSSSTPSSLAAVAKGCDVGGTAVWSVFQQTFCNLWVMYLAKLKNISRQFPHWWRSGFPLSSFSSSVR